MNPWPIKPLTPADLGFDVDSYDFSGFTGDQLSSTPSLENFLDNTLLDSLADLNDQTILIASMASQLDDAYTVLDELGNDDLESLFGNLTSAASAGDSLLADYGSSFSGGSSGGGAGGGGTPPSTTCTVIDLGQQPQNTGGQFTTFPINLALQNAGQGPFTIKALNWNPNLPTIFSVSPNIVGDTIAPGGTLNFAIIFVAAGDGIIDTTLTIQTDAPDPQPCVEAKVEIVPNPSSPGAGAGGGSGGTPAPQTISSSIRISKT